MRHAWRAPGLVLAHLALVLGAIPLAAAPLTETGRRAYEMARAADDGAAAALEEGEKTAALIKALAPERETASQALSSFLDNGEAAHKALTGYRRLAQASSSDALRLLADVSKMPNVPAPDVVRRDTLEQHALLAAHEASVMAARARTESERLRAILAEARLATAAGGGAPRGARAAPAASASPADSPPRGGADATPEGAGRGETVVPNLIGARLDAAVRDLEAAGLRLGPVTGPHDGFIVKQSPEAGANAPRRSAVGVTLSATAATVAPSQ